MERPNTEVGHVIHRSVGDFEKWLTPRTDIPKLRQEAMSRWRDAEVRGQLEAARAVLDRLAAAVAEASKNPRSYDDLLQQLDLKLISRDHDWRRVFTSLRGRGPEFAPYKAAAIEHYRSYLESRRSLLEYIRERRAALEATDEFDEEDLTQPFQRGAALMERLPRNCESFVKLIYRSDLRLKLGRHRFIIRDGYPPQLIDPKGRAQNLKRGKLALGRHPQSDLVIDRDYADVSRAHAVIEWLGGDTLCITDLSSRGTFVEKPSDD